MTEQPKDGGPAFPGPPKKLHILPDGTPIEVGFDGMSLRDWFAGQCMRDTFAALIASGSSNFNDYQIKRCAEASYRAADAMLAAREK